jgi:hypothetical protein
MYDQWSLQTVGIVDAHVHVGPSLPSWTPGGTTAS